MSIRWKRIGIWLAISAIVLSLFAVARIAGKSSQEQAYYTQLRRAAIAQDIGIVREFDKGYRECYPTVDFEPICRAIYIYIDADACLSLARELEDNPALENCDNASGHRYFEDGLFQINIGKVGDKSVIEVLYLVNIHHERQPDPFLDIFI